jgi:hypothetical protein
MAHWGLQVNLHGTSFIKINFNPRVCFYDYFFTQLYGPSYVKQILDGVKNSNDSTENKTRQFFTCIAKLLTLSGWFVKRSRKIEGGDEMMLRQFPTADCWLAKNVSHEAAKPRGRSNAALYRCFNH